MASFSSGVRSPPSHQSQAPSSIKNLPFRGERFYNPTPQEAQNGAIKLPVSTEGEILSEIDTRTGWVRVAIGQGNTFKSGIVPSWAIIVGGPRKVGNRKLVHDIPPIKNVHVSPQQINGNTSFHMAIRGLAFALKNHQQQLPFLSEESRDLLINDNRRNQFVEQFISHINPEFARVATGGNPTFGALRSRISPVKYPNTNHGIYFRVTSDFPADVHKLPEGYVGMTISNEGFAGRLHAHQNVHPSEQSMQAISVRQSKSCQMYILCKTAGSGLYFQLIEQIMILIMGTYGYKITQWIEDIKNNESMAVDDVVRKMNGMESAKLLLDIANSVFRDVGWTPLCSRPSFGISRVLNYESPLRGGPHIDKILWMLTVQPGVKSSYRRSALTATTSTSTPSIHFLNGNTYEAAYPRINKEHSTQTIYFRRDESYPSTKAEVTIVFEIMHNNAPHPYTWARLPDFGPYSDWHIANTLAIRIEWQEQGQWKYRYIQKIERAFMKTDDPGCLRAYSEAMGYIRYLQQVNQERPRGWDMTFGLARVKQVIVDHMTQTVHVQELTPSGRSMPAVTMKTRQDLGNDIRLLGAQNVNIPWPADFSLVRSGRSQRAHCDACFILCFYKVIEPYFALLA